MEKLAVKKNIILINQKVHYESFYIEFYILDNILFFER